MSKLSKVMSKTNADTAWKLFLNLAGSVNSADTTQTVVSLSCSPTKMDGIWKCDAEIQSMRFERAVDNVLLMDGSACDLLTIPTRDQKDHTELLALLK